MFPSSTQKTNSVNDVYISDESDSESSQKTIGPNHVNRDQENEYNSQKQEFEREREEYDTVGREVLEVTSQNVEMLIQRKTKEAIEASLVNESNIVEENSGTVFVPEKKIIKTGKGKTETVVLYSPTELNPEGRKGVLLPPMTKTPRPPKEKVELPTFPPNIIPRRPMSPDSDSQETEEMGGEPGSEVRDGPPTEPEHTHNQPSLQSNPAGSPISSDAAVPNGQSTKKGLSILQKLKKGIPKTRLPAAQSAQLDPSNSQMRTPAKPEKPKKASFIDRKISRTVDSLDSTIKEVAQGINENLTRISDTGIDRLDGQLSAAIGSMESASGRANTTFERMSETFDRASSTLSEAAKTTSEEFKKTNETVRGSLTNLTTTIDEAFKQFFPELSKTKLCLHFSNIIVQLVSVVVICKRSSDKAVKALAIASAVSAIVASGNACLSSLAKKALQHALNSLQNMFAVDIIDLHADVKKPSDFVTSGIRSLAGVYGSLLGMKVDVDKVSSKDIKELDHFFRAQKSLGSMVVGVFKMANKAILYTYESITGIPMVDAENRAVVENAYEWMKKVQENVHSLADPATKMAQFPGLIEQVISLYERGVEISKEIDTLKGYGRFTTFHKFLVDFKLIYSEALSLKEFSHHRSAPVVILLTGDPGMGKSDLSAFLTWFCQRMDGLPFTDFSIFRKSREEVHFEGYLSQYTTIIEEMWGQTGPNQRAQDNFYGDTAFVMDAATSVPCPLNMAFTKKGKVFFNSSLIIGSSNLLDGHTGTPRLPAFSYNNEAVRSRLDYVVKVAIKPQFKNVNGRGTNTATFDPTVWEIELYDPMRDGVKIASMDALTFARSVYSKLVANRDPNGKTSAHTFIMKNQHQHLFFENFWKTTPPPLQCHMMEEGGDEGKKEEKEEEKWVPTGRFVSPEDQIEKPREYSKAEIIAAIKKGDFSCSRHLKFDNALVEEMTHQFRDFAPDTDFHEVIFNYAKQIEDDPVGIEMLAILMNLVDRKMGCQTDRAPSYFIRATIAIQYRNPTEIKDHILQLNDCRSFIKTNKDELDKLVSLNSTGPEYALQFHSLMKKFQEWDSPKREIEYYGGMVNMCLAMMTKEQVPVIDAHQDKFVSENILERAARAAPLSEIMKNRITHFKKSFISKIEDLSGREKVTAAIIGSLAALVAIGAAGVGIAKLVSAMTSDDKETHSSYASAHVTKKGKFFRRSPKPPASNTFTFHDLEGGVDEVVKPEPLKEAHSLDQASSDVITHVIKPNTYRATLTSKPGVFASEMTIRCVITFIKERFAISCVHPWTRVLKDKRDWTVTLDSSLSSSRPVVVDASEILYLKQTKGDFMVIRFPAKVNQHKNIMGHFMTSKDVNALEGQHHEICMVSPRKTGLEVFCRDYIEFVDSFKSASKDGTIWETNDAFWSQLPSIPGDSGSLISYASGHKPRKIFGMNLAGNAAGTSAYHAVLTLDQIEAALGVFKDSSPHSEEVVAGHTAYVGEYPKEAKEPNAETIAKYATPNIGIVKMLEGGKFNRLLNKSSIIPSPICGRYKNIFEIPATLGNVKDGEGKTPLERFLKKCDKPVHKITDETMEIYRKVVQHHFRSRYSQKFAQPRVLTTQETLNGIPGLKFVGPINRKGSTGFPYSSEGFKFHYRDESDGLLKLTKEGKAEIEKWEKLAESGEKLALAFKLFPKDERKAPLFLVNEDGSVRDITVQEAMDEYVEEPLKWQTKVRYIFGANEVLKFLSKKYWGMFMHEQISTDKDARTGAKIGINPHSLDSHRLYVQRFEVGDCYRAAGDIIAMDVSLQAAILEPIHEEYNRWYTINPSPEIEKETKIREAISKTCLRPHLQVPGAIIEIDMGPSGKPSTALDNCNANVCMMKTVFYFIMKERGLPWSFDDFDKYVGYPVLGDDNLEESSVHLNVTFKDICSELEKRFGFKMVDYRKHLANRPDLWPDSHDVHEYEFLKRSFVLDEQGYAHLALRKSVIEDMANWITKGRDEWEALRDNMIQIVLESFHHGREYFTYILERCNSDLSHAGKRPLYYDYDEMMDKFLGGNFVDYFDESTFHPHCLESDDDNNDTGEFQMCPAAIAGLISDQAGYTVVPYCRDCLVPRCDETHTNHKLEFFQDWLTDKETDAEAFFERRSAQPDWSIDFAVELKALNETYHDMVAYQRAAVAMAIRIMNREHYDEEANVAVPVVNPHTIPGWNRDPVSGWWSIIQNHSDFQEEPTEAHINERNATVEFADETSTVQTFEFTRSKATRNFNPYPSENLEMVLKRPTNKTFSWTTATTVGNQLFAANFPRLILEENPYMWEVIRQFQRFSANIKIEMRINTTQFHAGALMVCYLPHTKGNLFVKGNEYDLNPLDPTFNAYVASTLPHVVLSANTPSVVSFTIPFVAPSQYWNPSHWATGDMDAFFGRVEAVVLSRLTNTQDGASPVTVSMFAQFEDIILTGPSPRNVQVTNHMDIEEGEDPFIDIPKKEEPVDKEQSVLSGGIISKGLKGLPKILMGLSMFPMLGGKFALVGMAAGGASLLAKSAGLNKATTVKAPEYRLLTTVDNMALGVGLESTMKFAMDPTNKVSTDVGIFGANRDFLLFKNYMRIPGVVSMFKIEASVVPGTIIRKIPVSPTWCHSEKTVGTGPRSFEASTPASYLASHFTMWCGSMDYYVMIFATKFVSGRLRITWAPALHHLPPGGLDQGASNLYNQVIDFCGDTQYKFSVPYLALNDWCRCFPASALALQMENPTSEAHDTMSGTLLFSVANELAYTMEPNTASVDVVIYSAPGPDMKFQMPANLYRQARFHPRYTDHSSEVYENHSDESWSSPREVFEKTFDPIHTGAQYAVRDAVEAGEHVLDWKTLFHRYTGIGVLNDASTVLNQAWWRGTSTFTSSQMKAFLSAFQFYRGSFRYKVFTPKKDTMLDVSLVPNVDKTYDGLPMHSSVTNLMRGLSGTIHQLSNVRPYLEFEVPYYSVNMMRSFDDGFVFAGESDLFAVPNVNVLPFDEGAIEAIVFSAVGDDFSVGIPVNPPVISFPAAISNEASAAIGPAESSRSRLKERLKQERSNRQFTYLSQSTSNGSDDALLPLKGANSFQELSGARGAPVNHSDVLVLGKLPGGEHPTMSGKVPQCNRPCVGQTPPF